MSKLQMAVFGEAEKGEFNQPYICHQLADLQEKLGNPPSESQGLIYAIQAIMYGRTLIYFRVKEEGFSIEDYQKGLQALQDRTSLGRVHALFMPGVGDTKIISEATAIVMLHQGVLLFTEKDLYDFCTTD